MKKKKPIVLFAVILCAVFSVFCTACGASSAPNAPQKEPPAEVLPEKSQIVEARQRVVRESVQGYDFSLSLTGNFSVIGLGTSLNGKYDGAYRYNKSEDKVAFRRKTSGELLADSSLYIITSGDNRIKMTMKDGTVKKIAVETAEDQNLTMINLPVVALVDSVKESNIVSVGKSELSGYSYSCALAFDKTNIAYDLINKVMEKLETGVSFKGIDLSLDTSKMYFNIVNDKINDFKLGFQMKMDVKGVDIAVTFEYEQKGNLSEIQVPSDSNISYKANEIQAYTTEIDNAIDDIKNDPVYALHLTAVNEFDPGWNHLAIKDSYEAKMYKNTDGDNTWFNHSYCYKSHSEADGKESYKYTLGNVNGNDIDNQGVWLVSRKGSNAQTKEDNVTAETQFEFLTSMIKHRADEIDCIKKRSNENETLYTLYLNRIGTDSVQKKIINMINTNQYGDVIAVDNYFNSDNSVIDAEIEVRMIDGKIMSVACKTKLRYTPTGGEYTEYNITLDNSMLLEFNGEKDYKKALEYVAPTKVKGTLGVGKNLNDSEYYIL